MANGTTVDLKSTRTRLLLVAALCCGVSVGAFLPLEESTLETTKAGRMMVDPGMAAEFAVQVDYLDADSERLDVLLRCSVEPLRPRSDGKRTGATVRSLLWDYPRGLGARALASTFSEVGKRTECERGKPCRVQLGAACDLKSEMVQRSPVTLAWRVRAIARGVDEGDLTMTMLDRVALKTAQ